METKKVTYMRLVEGNDGKDKRAHIGRYKVVKKKAKLAVIKAKMVAF